MVASAGLYRAVWLGAPDQTVYVPFRFTDAIGDRGDTILTTEVSKLEGGVDATQPECLFYVRPRSSILADKVNVVNAKA